MVRLSLDRDGNGDPLPMTTPAKPAGWYADPSGLPATRWWDGRQWTDHLQPGAAVLPPTAGLGGYFPQAAPSGPMVPGAHTVVPSDPNSTEIFAAQSTGTPGGLLDGGLLGGAPRDGGLLGGGPRDGGLLGGAGLSGGTQRDGGLPGGGLRAGGPPGGGLSGDGLLAGGLPGSSLFGGGGPPGGGERRDSTRTGDRRTGSRKSDRRNAKARKSSGGAMPAPAAEQLDYAMPPVDGVLTPASMFLTNDHPALSSADALSAFGSRPPDPDKRPNPRHGAGLLTHPLLLASVAAVILAALVAYALLR